MIRKPAVVVVLAFVAGFACAIGIPPLRAQGRVTELKRVDDGKPPQTFRVGDVTQENPGEVSESDILTPTRVLLFRILEKGQPETRRIQ